MEADMIATSDDWGVAKPDVAFFDEVVKASPCAPAGCPTPPGGEILYVGDRLDNDIRPAHAAGLRTALIRREPWAAIWHDERDVAPLPTMRIDSLAELPERIEAFNAAAR